MKDYNSVVIIDDHPLIREGLKAIINKSRNLSVVGEAENVEDGYKLVLKIRPDIILLDIVLHGSSGLELGKKLLAADRDLKIITITMHSKIQYIIDALDYGIKGYILKDTNPEAILNGIQKVLEGEIFVDSYISNKVITQLISGRGKDPELFTSKSYDSLTVREQEVLRLLVNGTSIKQIGNELFISAKTVENHKASIMSKLKCKNMVELVRFAFEIGLIDSTDS
ncbi:MAG: response regulator transcription factor [Spirochaetia bacterium]|jgi:DNA-binding NarL/FixJ family response regulator|nr:response regulator transcription factor [Spirochaetia bacterium]